MREVAGTGRIEQSSSFRDKKDEVVPIGLESIGWLYGGDEERASLNGGECHILRLRKKRG